MNNPYGDTKEFFEPLILDEQLYDELVVDYLTGQMVSHKPWLITFIKKNCVHCTRLKPKVEEVAHRMNKHFNVAFVFQSSELLKETYQIKYFPSIFLLKEG